MLPDPPLLKLEVEATTAYLSMLQHLNAMAPPGVKAMCELEERLVQLCMRNLQRFESGGESAGCLEHSIVMWAFCGCVVVHE